MGAVCCTDQHHEDNTNTPTLRHSDHAASTQTLSYAAFLPLFLATGYHSEASTYISRRHVRRKEIITPGKEVSTVTSHGPLTTRHALSSNTPLHPMSDSFVFQCIRLTVLVEPERAQAELEVGFKNWLSGLMQWWPQLLTTEKQGDAVYGRDITNRSNMSVRHKEHEHNSRQNKKTKRILSLSITLMPASAAGCSASLPAVSTGNPFATDIASFFQGCNFYADTRNCVKVGFTVATSAAESHEELPTAQGSTSPPPTQSLKSDVYRTGSSNNRDSSNPVIDPSTVSPSHIRPHIQ